LHNIRCEDSRNLSNRKREYMEDRTNELALNGKKKKNIKDLYRGINECKKGCKSRTSLVKDKR
jgi:hypothetical protein